MIPELPQALTLFLPGVTIGLSAYISHDRLSVWWNSLIILIITLLGAFIWALVTPPISQSFWGDVMIIATYCLVLGYGPFSPLYQWLVERLPSPLSIFIKEAQGPLAAISLKSMVSRAVTPPTQPTTWRATTQSWPVQSSDAQTPGESVIDKPVPPPEQTPPS